MAIKIIGCGNLLAGDDGIGIHVLNELKKTYLPSHIQLFEGGTDPLRLLDLLRNTSRVILIDAITGAGNPGEVFILTPEQIDTQPFEPLSLHQFSLPQIFQFGSELYPQEMPKEIFIVGIEGKSIDAYCTGLSPAVEQAIPQAIVAVLNLCGIEPTAD